MIDENDILEVCENAVIARLIELERVEPIEAQQLLDPVFDELRERLAGVGFVIKKRCRRKKSAIKNQVREAFDGRNVDDLVERFNLSRATIYRIISKKTDF